MHKNIPKFDEKNTYYIYLDSSKSTKSTELYGPGPAMEYLILQRRYLIPIVKKFGGNVENICWDSFLAAFTDPISAIYAAHEIKDTYETNENFKQNYKSSKISLSGLAISQDKEICEEIGENQCENGEIVIHGSALIDLIKKNIHYYGFQIRNWENRQKVFDKEEFVLIERSKYSDVKEINNKIMLFISPKHLNKNELCAKTIINNKGFHLEVDDGLWFFDDKNHALQAAESIFKENDGKCKISINNTGKIMVHEGLKIISCYGINANCKLAEDVENERNSIRVFKSVYNDSPGDKYSLKSAEISGLKISFWDSEII